MKAVFVAIFLVVLVAVLTSLLSVSFHEQAHQVIFREFDVNSHVAYGFPNSYTIQDQNFLSEEDRRASLIAHGVNEAVGYQIAPLLIIIIAIQFAGLLLKIQSVKKDV